MLTVNGLFLTLAAAFNHIDIYSQGIKLAYPIFKRAVAKNCDLEL